MSLVVYRRLTLAVILGLGLWQTGEGLWIPAKAWLAQQLIAHAWDEAMATRRPVPPWPWADTTPVARLVVPALGVDQIVLAHATGRTLAFGPAHLDGSPAPGAAGLSVVSGHRDTSFRFLANVTPGTALRIQRADGAWVDYVIREIQVVDARTVRLPLVGNGPPQLALTTCYPFDAVMPGGPLRLVALAEAVPTTTTEQRAGLNPDGSAMQKEMALGHRIQRRIHLGDTERTPRRRVSIRSSG